jgi:transmembrane sensor
VAVDFAGAQRRVTLTRGEVHFTVAKDATRPFVVTAAGMEVRAVGTAFSVQVSPRELAVLVTEGRVALERPTASPAGNPVSTLLEAGQRAVAAPAEGADHVGAGPQVAALGPTELAAHLAWRIPRLEFSGTRLGDALASFATYRPMRVTLADPRLADLRISGIVRADNLAALLQLLESNYAVVVRPGAEGELVLGRK